jgi:hypothetical protein
MSSYLVEAFATYTTRRDATPAKTSAGVQEVAPSPLPLVIAGARYRTRPARRRQCSQLTLAVSAAVGPRSQRAAAGKIAAGHPPKYSPTMPSTAAS